MKHIRIALLCLAGGHVATSPVIIGDVIYIRTATDLYAFRASAPAG